MGGKSVKLVMVPLAWCEYMKGEAAEVRPMRGVIQGSCRRALLDSNTKKGEKNENEKYS